MKKLLYLFDKVQDNENLRVKVEGKEHITLKIEDFNEKVQSNIKILVKKFNSTFYNNLEMP
jgi:hypothetical protein